MIKTLLKLEESPTSTEYSIGGQAVYPVLIFGPVTMFKKKPATEEHIIESAISQIPKKRNRRIISSMLDAYTITTVQFNGGFFYVCSLYRCSFIPQN